MRSRIQILVQTKNVKFVVVVVVIYQTQYEASCLKLKTLSFIMSNVAIARLSANSNNDTLNIRSLCLCN